MRRWPHGEVDRWKRMDVGFWVSVGAVFVVEDQDELACDVSVPWTPFGRIWW